MKRILNFYHAVIFQQAARDTGRPLSVRTQREMETLAEAVGCLIEGDLPRLGDVIYQRYAALEKAHLDGSWLVAQELEVLEQQRLGLATDEQVLRGSRRQLEAARLQQTLLNLQRHSENAG